ncbi:MAG: hypothetical protein KGL90_02295 [Burkholderiales bacterium]|nr:hypothetical protein [Burkholderiales bacterium]
MNPNEISDSDLFGRINGWPDFIDRVRAGMAMAAAQPAPLYLCDSDFSRWPLGELSVMEAFQQWGLNSRGPHCTLVATTLDEIPRRHPRWVAWRGTWAHRVRCYQPMPEEVLTLAPIWLLQGRLGLRLLNPLTGQGLWTRKTDDLLEWHQEIDVILQRCEEALPPTTLGL